MKRTAALLIASAVLFSIPSRATAPTEKVVNISQLRSQILADRPGYKTCDDKGWPTDFIKYPYCAGIAMAIGSTLMKAAK